MKISLPITYSIQQYTSATVLTPKNTTIKRIVEVLIVVKKKQKQLR